MMRAATGDLSAELEATGLEDWIVGGIEPRPARLPNGWRLVRLTDIAKLESGHTPSRRRPDYWGGDVPWVSLNDINDLDSREVVTSKEMINALGLANSSARLLPSGTVIFSRTASIGKSTILGRPMATTQDFANYICGPELHNVYLMYLFRYMKSAWKRLMAGSTHNTIYMPVFRQLQILLPPLSEQRAIAAALSDADALIASLDALVAKKRDLKQAAMHQLLTGKTRLPGFSGQWEVKRLADVCRQITDGTHFTPSYVTQGVPFYSVENVTADDFANTKFISRADHNVLVGRCKPERGDILLTRIGSLGVTKLIDWDVDASIYVSLALLKLKPCIDPIFFHMYTKSRAFRRDVEGRGLMNAAPQKINMGEIASVPIPLPPMEEQVALGAMLHDMTAEVTTLEAKRDKASALKQGMMQELLTGRVRLI